MATRLNGLDGNNWDALVIGAGPAGGVCAAVLASRGMRTLLVDRRGFPRRKVCGGCLAPAGVRALAEAGLGGVLDRVGTRRIGTLRMFARGASLPVTIEPYVTVERAEFDEAVALEAVARGAVFLDGVSARVLGDDSVELSEGDETSVLTPGVIVVADGLSGSSLAKRPEFAWRVRRRSVVGVGTLLAERPGYALEGEITMVCGRGGYVGAAPMADGRWSLAAALAPGLVRGVGPVDGLGAVLAESGLEAPAVGRGGLRGVGNLTRRRRAAAGRVLVVGDAGGYEQPLTGEGMSWAMACAARIGACAEAVAGGEDAAGRWRASCERVLSRRRLVCRAVCALAGRPLVLRGVIGMASGIPVAGWAGRRLCWRSA